jgi:hypothetical protein
MNQFYYPQQITINNNVEYNHNSSLTSLGTFYEPYYNSYWYSKSDCSSSSIDTTESTSPQSNRQLYYNNYYYSYNIYNNVSPSQPLDSKKCIEIPVYSNDEFSKPTHAVNVENKFGMCIYNIIILLV